MDCLQKQFAIDLFRDRTGVVCSCFRVLCSAVSNLTVIFTKHAIEFS